MSDYKENRSAFRYVLVWTLGVLQVLTTTAVIAGVGALWSMSSLTAALVVEVTTIKADAIAMRTRQEKSESEAKRISDEQIRNGIVLEHLRERK